MDNNFSFEYFLELKLDDFIKIWKTPLSTDKIKNKILKKLLLPLLLIPIILLFLSKYTIILGIIIILIIIISFILSRFAPKLIKFGLRSTYFQNKLLHYKLKYYINEKGVGVKGKFIDSFIYWNFVHVWQIRGNWLILSPLGVPQLYFQISILKENGIYEKIMNMLKKYGIQYNSKESHGTLYCLSHCRQCY